MSAQAQAKKELATLVTVLDPILTPHGFTFFPGDTGVSSGGGFANGHYRQSTNELGLIYRGSELGCPNYVSEGVGAGHHELMRELGRAEDCALWFDDALDKWCLVARDGRRVTDALVADLSTIVLPCLSQTPAVYRSALGRAFETRMNRLKGA